MVATNVITPYQTAMPYVRTALASWLDEYTAQRQASYDLYDDLYKNSSLQGKFMIRGSNDQPVYLPTAKGLINNMARYVGRDWGYSAAVIGTDPEDESEDLTDPAVLKEHQAVLDAIDALFRRNRLVSQFQASKKEFLRRGDWVWYISADPDKEQGSRISIAPVDPRRYRVIQDDPEDSSRVTGAWLFEEVVNPADDSKMAVKVQEWLKPSSPAYPFNPTDTDVSYSVAIYDQEDWQDDFGDISDDAKIIQTVVPATALAGISQIPLYHIKNNAETDNPYGTSDLEGLESVIGGINQTASDEDWAVSTMGVGMFVAEGTGAPVDENGNPVNWKLGPGQVTEIGASTPAEKRSFTKIDGITSVQPMQDHLKMMKDSAQETTALSDVATGRDSTNASGVALALKLQPTFDAADEKDISINEVWTQLLYDLRQWFQVYESLDISAIRLTSTTSKEGRVPFDRDSRFAELIDLAAAGLVTPQYAQQKLNDDFGYDIDLSDMAQGVAPAGGDATDDALTDSRVSDELNADA